MKRQEFLDALSEDRIKLVSDLELKTKELTGNYNKSSKKNIYLSTELTILLFLILDSLKKPVSLFNKSKTIRREREKDLEELEDL